MGLFSKTAKADPKITFEGVKFTFHRDYQGWNFSYRDTEFISYEAALTLTSKAELETVLDTINSLKPEMRARLQKALGEPGTLKLDDGESYLVNVQHFASNKSFTVSWSGGRSWGDLAVDFTVKDALIVDENWGD